ncbi:glycosyl hydrolase family 65 protein [Pontiellaceae bacterium B12227]|nr:glycosyl hydrolase family 65 protein [Pontiellaceae bacterium B12227]
MNEWQLNLNEYSAEEIALNGNRFMLGNGYMGVRGTLEEHGKDELAGVMLNGVYDQAPGQWREPVNAPNPLFSVVEGAGKIISHEQVLDIRFGHVSRKTVYENAIVEADRFVSMADVHLICLRYSASGDLPIHTGIDTDVWDINGPHFQCLEQNETEVVVKTNELGITVAVCTAIEWLNERSFHKFTSIYTSLDCTDPITAARESCVRALAAGYAELSEAHDARWNEIWNRCDVRIEGDDDAQFALRYSLYQLQLAAPRHSDRVSIPARALSGQVYKGAVFWDTEMFMTPVFTLTDPAVARNLIMYRYHTLGGAREKALEYGFRGAFYAWEGQEHGNDACTHFNVTDVFTNRPMRTYFRDKQIHISADIVYAIWKYYEQTNDFSIFTDGAAEVVVECARFFYSYAFFKKDKERFELLDVTGPDEYHERVNNNAYTNRMVKFTLDTAIRVLDLLEEQLPADFQSLETRTGFMAELNAWKEMASNLWIPAPDPQTGLIEQFDGYEKLEDCSLKEIKGRVLDPNEYFGGGNGLATTTKILKQADVVLMLNLFQSDYDVETIRANWEYYEPRTEHGSSLSACAYAMVAARIGNPDWAYDYFMKTATVDLTGKSKQYVGTLYIGGTHPAANGGAWLSAVLGFAGLHVDENGIHLNPNLPSRWTGMSFGIEWRGERYQVEINGRETKVTPGKEICNV